jgi:hypothetical protein
MRTNENLTGPSNGLLPLIATLALAVAAAGGLWMAHKRFYHDPRNPVGPVEQQHTAAE